MHSASRPACGDALCQARDGSNATVRSYYDEGEFVPGSLGQPYFYGIDQLGSVRRAFASTSPAPAFNYAPYGAPLSGPAPTTDFGFAGLFNHTASGLNLTLFRAYDPLAGRWLSRDPMGEASDPSKNLYPYVAGNTPNVIDPLGLVGVPGPSPSESPPSDCDDARKVPQDRGPAPCLLAGMGGMPCPPGGGGGAGGGGGGAKGGDSGKFQPPVARGNPPKVEYPDPLKGSKTGTEDRRLQDQHDHQRLTGKKADPSAKPPTNPQTPGEKILDGLGKVLDALQKMKDFF